MREDNNRIAHYHLPGLFEFYELYLAFLPIYREHPEYFYDWCDIGSIYGAPADCLWGGGRVGFGDNDAREVSALLKEYDISGRLTFSNSLLGTEHLGDRKCNFLCEMFDGVIVHSDLLLNYLMDKYPKLYFVSSTTKVITDFSAFESELVREEFKFVVPDFRLNKAFDRLTKLPQDLKNKVEFLCNECCYIGCTDRYKCYEEVSKKSLGSETSCERNLLMDEFKCKAPDAKEGYKFSKAMENPAFIGIDDINRVYLPMGFTNFKIEGRSLGSAIVLEFLLYYMTKPEYQLKVREEVYLDSMLDLF